jgi:hypothetical protein
MKIPPALENVRMNMISRSSGWRLNPSNQSLKALSNIIFSLSLLFVVGVVVFPFAFVLPQGVC